MRIKVILENLKGEKINLPIHYNHLIQSFIYNNIDIKLADFLHNDGFGYGKRRFKMFVFSRIFSDRLRLEGDEIIFGKEIYFFLSSPLREFITQFSELLMKRVEFRLYENFVGLKGIEILRVPEFKERMAIRMLSPLTVYSTLYSEEKRRTYYYSPFEDKFGFLVEDNLKRKYLSFYKEVLDFSFKIVPRKVDRDCEKIILYKGTVIKGWLGDYEIESKPEIIKFAYDVGLGSKNSQGFGMFEVCI